MKESCQICGIWVCSKCGWIRVRANREYQQDCFKCSTNEGTFRPVYHQPWRAGDHKNKQKENL